mgnify:CR=1 FL=1
MCKIMIRYIRLLFVSAKYSFKTEISYRASYLINRIAQALAYGMAFILMWIMVGNFGTLNGWNKYEVLLLYASSLMSYSLAGSIVIGLYNNLQKDVMDGTFDDVLLKPVAVLPYLITTRFTWAYLSHIFLSFGVMLYSFQHLNRDFNIKFALGFVLQIIFGALIYFSLLLIIRTPVFFFIKFESVSDFFFFFREMSYYPLSIYPKAMQTILLYILPYAFINYIPMKHMLGKEDFFIGGEISIFLSPLVAVLLLIMAVLFFDFGVNHYKSTGS